MKQSSKSLFAFRALAAGLVTALVTATPAHALDATMTRIKKSGVIKMGHRDAAVPMICLETALPVKFSATIVEALGREPERPAAFAGIETLPQRCDSIAADVEAVKHIIAARG